MKTTEFAMMIVDDNHEVAESIAAEISTWLEDKGLELKVTYQTKKSGVLEELKDNDVELLVIDYGLDDKDNGDVIIEEIRRNDYYHDIIFYTGGSIEKILEKKYNGVFNSSKKDAPMIIKEVIDLRIKRFSDLATLRGWVVADAIELEYMIEQLLLKWFNPKHGIFESQIMRRPGILDFYKKQMTLNGILSEELRIVAEKKDTSERAKKIQECKEIFKSFETDVVHYRNAIAHSKLELSAEGKKCLKAIGGPIKIFQFDEKDLVETRKKFRAQRDCLITLLEYL